ncbi:OsmC family protein [Psychrosphaera aquimarina]|uniref:OsmC family protein n=1 Tax=Psychrosphaera aquimarina TaxID=2044854 RepID=A0ABU3QZK3_9GAMM|nr:OsmC family protein [Psychrosphaera aquimarina]MDU0112647.1 OsmC family protein [Psychrosphaera aquimarina]
MGFSRPDWAPVPSMTIRMYARRKGWPLDHVSVDVNHNKVHAQDAETCRGRQDRHLAAAHIACRQAQPGTTRKRLLEIADKCPVHRTLERSSTVVTELAE